jgi:hypothetical protein
MAVEDVVTILMEYCEDGEETFRDLHGPEAAVAVQDVVDLLEGELAGQLEYDALWSEFESAPRETAPALSGALEAMIEADPGLGEQMELLLEEYYSTSSPVGPAVGDQMPESEASEFVPREAPRIEEHEAEPRGHTDAAGEGTYLYGNVRSGDTTVEKAVELSPDVLQVGREEEMLEFDIDELFEQLRVTVGREPALSDETRERLVETLEGLEAELALGEDADEERVVEHLRRVGRLDPDFLDLLLSGLRHTRSEAQGVVERAVGEVRRE